MAKKKLTKQNKFIIGFAVIAVGLFLGLYIFPSVLGWYSLTPAVTPTAETEYRLNFFDALDSTNDDEVDPTIAWVTVDISDLEVDEIEDLVYTDYTSDGSGDDHDYDEDEIHIAKITQTGFVSQYWTTDSRVADGNLPLLQLGDNNVYLYNTTEDVSIAAWSKLGVTVNQTDEDEWIIVTNCLDASEAAAADVTHKEGYRYYYDFENACWMAPTIKVTYNTTATSAFVALEDTLVHREACSTVYTYIELNTNLSDVNEFHLDFGSGLGTDFEVITITFGYGNIDSYTSWDSQS